MRRLLIILITLVLASVPLVGAAATDQRIALVIGNGNYTDAPLRKGDITITNCPCVARIDVSSSYQLHLS